MVDVFVYNYMLQVAEWWGEQHYDDFAAVVQPFFSGTTAQNLSIEFLSTVSAYYTED